jgi:hypothetical protein
MRIGLIAPPWVPVPPKRYGGTEAVVDRLARGFADAGHEVLLSAVAGSQCPVAQVRGTDAVAYVTGLHRALWVGCAVAVIGAAVSAVLFRQGGE